MIKILNKTYRLSNGTILSFQECDDGFDYTIYNSEGLLLDGGVLEYSCDKDIDEKQILESLSYFTNLPQLLDDNKIEIKDFEIEDFQYNVRR